ncbi:MAG: DNA internalization-related competence protein ComEC/Rec2 [Burkholderiales bacterium]|nr:DNA internalization-related competence protein ComEC/Rec2 [Burkholderiales bacterium]
MTLWAMAMLAWLAGVAVQLQQTSVSPVKWAQAACLLAVLAGVLAIWAWARRPGRPGRHVARMGCWVACALLAWGSTSWRAHEKASQVLPSAWQDQDVMVVGEVLGLPEPRGQALGFDVAVRQYEFQGRIWPVSQSSVGGRPLPDRVSLYWAPVGDDGQAPGRSDGPGPLKQVQAGQVWRLPVRLQSPIRAGNPGSFDAALWLFDRGVRATGSVRPKVAEPRLLAQPKGWWSAGCVDRARQLIRAAIGRQVSDPRLAGVLAGLTVGDQAAIDHDDWDVFRKTGVAHLVSISGLHIAMVGWMAGGALSWGWRRSERLMHRWPAPTVQLIGGVVAAALYSLLAGWGVPAQRTVGMMALWAALRLSGRRWPWPLVWLLSAVVVTLMDPWALYQAGFWLSFVAVGVLMSSGPAGPSRGQDAAHWHWRVWGKITAAVRTQWLATVSLTPLAAVFFHQVSVVGFVANLFAIPIFTLLITPLTLAGAAWSPVWSVAAWVLAQSIQVLSWMAAWPWSVAPVAALPSWVSVVSVAAAGAVALPVPWRWRLIGVPMVLPLVCLPTAWHLQPPPAPGQFILVAPDVGQGTAVLVRTAHHALLFDAGPKVGERSDAGQRVLLPMLASLGVTHLDELLISHRDTDHVGGAASVVDAVPVMQLRSSLEDEHRLRQKAPGGLVLRHVRCETGQRWQWDGVVFDVLNPSAEDYERRDDLSSNALSCVLRIQAQARSGHEAGSALLAADMEAAQEAATLDRAQSVVTGPALLRSTVLVAPHHGSKTSSSEGFLLAVQPVQTVIQVGRRNRYGHPSPEVMARYDGLSLARVATPACGAFLWNSAEVLPVSRPTPTSTMAGDVTQHLRLGECWRQRAGHYWDGQADG